jgi:hypothetical protein
MNIFVLDSNPVKAAIQQCDKHVVKMVLESAQMLCTAHRLLDGTMQWGKSASGRKMKHWILDDPDKDAAFYKAVHCAHPCTLWTMESIENYEWHHAHFNALCEEYTRRYGKVHMCETKLLELLIDPPANIPQIPQTRFKLAMGAAPQCMHPEDPVRSYREFYQTKQERFSMTWTKREVPTWFKVA